jgi:hypothetical protein
MKTTLGCLGLIVLFACGCASNKLTRLEDLSQNEAVAIAKFRVLHNGKDVTKGGAVLFNAPATGIPKYDYMIGEDGYVFAKLPVGENSINYILHPDRITQHRFPSPELSFHLKEGRAIYYIGDITFDWQGSGSSANWTVFVLGALAGGATGLPGAELAGPLAGGAAGRGRIAVAVDSNPAAAQEAFRRKFPNDREVIPSLLVVTPRR